MANIHEVLRMKENELAKVRQEIQALRTVAPLLSEDDEPEVLEADEEPAHRETVESVVEDDLVAEQGSDKQGLQETSPILSAAIPPKRSRLRNWLGRAAGE